MDRPFPPLAQFANVSYLESLYADFQKDPTSIDPTWRGFFEGVDFASYLFRDKVEVGTVDRSPMRIYRLIQLYRRFGHLLAKFNPIETRVRTAHELEMDTLRFHPQELEALFPTLGFCGKSEATLKEIIGALSSIYCGPIGFEYMDVGSHEIEQWIQKRIEPELIIQPSIEERHLILEELYKAESFEAFLHTKYVGQKRFSLEGGETLIPILSAVVERGADLGVSDVVMGMAHRGRLNVLVNLFHKPYSAVFRQFEEGYIPQLNEGSDDVKYHLGYQYEGLTRSQKKVRLTLAANPSHLESVDPVVLGQAYAIQRLKQDKKKTLPILVHGDASIAGQGVVYESMQFCRLPGYSTGGTLHIVVNNQIGFTTTPEEGRSTRYCTDIAKAFSAPVFHVNAEDPESCYFAAKLALELREEFGCDVFIDLNCYRKYGHNEGDEPSFTQPLEYQKIREKKGIRALYEQKLNQMGLLEQKLVETVEGSLKESLQRAQQEVKASPDGEEALPPTQMAPTSTPPVSVAALRELAARFSQVPAGFHLHPKLQKWVQERAQKETIDWSLAEWLAFASLLQEKKAIRLSGQDCRRGTFSQRHAMWVDVETAKPYFPLAEIGPFEVYNSPLSEFAVLGFEYGYTNGDPASFVLWEAQYGDFANGAEVILDQYIAAGEVKWGRTSSLTLLLPHGYEGQGPEHSSGRMERYLQLAAAGNVQIAIPSTAAQYFHLLRRQAHLQVRRPLIVFTPKSLLRSPSCQSRWEELAEGSFQLLLGEVPKETKRVLFCTGKIYYELLEMRKDPHIALVRVEQLYPFPLDACQTLLKDSSASEFFWVQEEPKNMGAWECMQRNLNPILPKPLRFVGRNEAAATATGSLAKHKQEQAALIQEAFS